MHTDLEVETVGIGLKEKGLEFILPGMDELGKQEEKPKEAEKQATEAKPGKTYELVIIGAGPAGLAASVYAARKRLEVLLISKNIGGQVLLTSDVENYIGYQYIEGRELIEKFKAQVEQFPIDMAVGEEVSGIKRETAEEGSLSEGGGSRTKEVFLVSTASDKVFKGATVIIATGKRSRPLNVPGERELVGRGVSYCATCDAPLFGGQDVAVIGGGNSAFTAANDLVKIANRVYVINMLPTWQADYVLVEKAAKSGKMEGLLEHGVIEVRGRERVEGIRVESKKTGEVKDLKVGGVFIEIGLIPNSEFAKNLVELNRAGEIIVDCACRTSKLGVFAAGDVTTVPEKQIIVAAGEGAKAALGAYKYLLERG